MIINNNSRLSLVGHVLVIVVVVAVAMICWHVVMPCTCLEVIASPSSWAARSACVADPIFLIFLVFHFFQFSLFVFNWVCYRSFCLRIACSGNHNAATKANSMLFGEFRRSPLHSEVGFNTYLDLLRCWRVMRHESWPREKRRFTWACQSTSNIGTAWYGHWILGRLQIPMMPQLTRYWN